MSKKRTTNGSHEQASPGRSPGHKIESRKGPVSRTSSRQRLQGRPSSPRTRSSRIRRASGSLQQTLAFIGAGRTGSALARGLSRRGWTIAAIASEHASSARRLARLCGALIATTDPVHAARAADIVILAVPDRRIADVVRKLAVLPEAGDPTPVPDSPSGAPSVAEATPKRRKTSASMRTKVRPLPISRSERIVLHTAGALGAEALDVLRARGWAVGSFHPLSAFPLRSSEVPDLGGTRVAIDGQPRARRAAKALATSLGARVLVLPSRVRARYHLAACFASNYVVTLASEAADLLSRAGLSRGRALRALLPLMRSTLTNLENAGLPNALTGPVARGDVVTVARHASLLRKAPVDLDRLHALLVRRTARLALASHRIDTASARRIERAVRSSRHRR